uniref:Netrin 1 n=1 Tax=Schmidtea mediterranea TaxID=79327 RepID=Q49BF9_SCHMD|nr:netrin 1 [Schmidtea mediterranea]
MNQSLRNGICPFVIFAILIQCQAQHWLHGGSNSLCYSEGKAFRCVPPFTNIIENMIPDEITSTCGQNKKQWICVDHINCHSCMKDTHSINYLTDQHLNNNITFWASDFVNHGDNVNITFSFGKLFEIYYISLVLIPLLEPDSIIISKSIDNGTSWTEWHYFSKDCYRSFGIQPMDFNHYSDSKITESTVDQSLTCTSIPDSKLGNLVNSPSVLAFTTNNPNFFSHASDQYNSWMSATNIRITLRKSETNFLNSHLDGFTYPPHLKQYFNRIYRKNNYSSILPVNRKLKQKKRNSPSVLKISDFFALADISIGGRCQCYGHAGRCLKNPVDNTYHCDCQHNTAGKDCEMCREGFVDKRWSVATVNSAAECKRCNCNLHSKKCEFNEKLYIVSNKQSGGVCVDCEHNTDGRYCHQCNKGYHRDWSKPLSHHHVCIKCRCHPIGSIYPDVCDQRNSQCTCKTGVGGLSCNRCQKGFQQTKSPITPCVDVIDLHKIPMAQAPENRCQHCNNKRKRIRFKKYCRKDAVLLVTMQSREQHGEMARFEMKVNYVYRIDTSKFTEMHPDFLASMNGIMSNQFIHSTFPMWIKETDLKCKCPSLQLGMTYLVILKLHAIKYLERSELLLDQKSVALPWQKTWERRMKKFSNKEHQGLCEKWKLKRRYYRRQKHTKNYV